MFHGKAPHTWHTLQMATEIGGEGRPLWVVVRIEPHGTETVVSKPLPYREALGEKQDLEVKLVTGGSEK